MAAGWIKMRVDLHAHPKVVRISSAVAADRLRVVGALLVVWSVFDAHTETGRLEGYTLEAMDSVVGWPGFSAAMVEAKWLVDDNGQALIMPEFTRHNGESAKRRAMDAERKRSARTSGDCPDSVRKMSAVDADKKRTREEKRREENIQTDRQTAAQSAPAARAPKLSDSEWLESIKANPAYAGVEIDREIGKCNAWCATNRKMPTRGRILNWLNRADRPIGQLNLTQQQLRPAVC